MHSSIKRTEGEGKGAFQAFVAEKVIGKMSYKMFGSSQLIIEHTEINADFKGKGIGMKLLTDLIAFARKNNFRIIPICPFAKKMFERHPDLQDVL